MNILYFNRMLWEEENKIKIILVGDAGVGKTNIRERFCQNKFQPFSIKTVGVQVSTRRFIAPFQQKPQTFTVHFWDVSGQINNRELIPAYFKSAMGVIYVFDLTNEESLNNLEKWKEKVEEQNPIEMKTLLLGNKKDLRQLREVTESAAIKFQHSNKISQYSQISALQSLGGTEEAIYQYLALIQRDFMWGGLTKSTKLKLPEGNHRICI